MSARAGLTPAQLLRAAARHRALLAGGLAAASVATGLGALAPSDPPTTVVLAAAADLPTGAVLAHEDLVEVGLPAAAVPDGALTDPAQAVGRPVAGAVRRGEPLTDARLLGASLLPTDSVVATPVRVADPATGALVSAGDRVDVLAASPHGGTARVVAAALTVLGVPDVADDPGEGALLVLAAPPALAARLAGAAVTDRLSVTVRRS